MGRLITESYLSLVSWHKDNRAYYRGWLYAFFAGVFCVLGSTVLWAQEAQQATSHHLSTASLKATSSKYPSRLWKIELEDHPGKIKPSYVLGTMHLPDKEVVNLPPHIDSIVASADLLCIEVILSDDAFKALADLSTLKGKETLSDLIGSREFHAVSKVLQPRGVTTHALERLKPWAAALIMNYPPPSLDPILDYSLQLRFRSGNRPVYQLETAREQIQIFNQMAISDQIKFLRFSLQQQQQFDFYLQQMKALYLADDLDGLQALTEQQMAQTDQQFMELLLAELIDKRNLKMVDRMQMHLQQGNALIAIGALHLTGDYGILQLLSDFGYRVSPVLAKD